MPIKRVFLVGAGGHGRVVLDAMLKCGIAPARIRIRDDNPALKGKSLLGHAIQVPAIPAKEKGANFHVAIGNAAIREKTQTALERLGLAALTVCHPTAAISSFAAIGRGSLVAATAVVGPSATLGDGVIVNHGAVIDHDCIVGAFSHISPNAALGGGAKIGKRAMIGAGAVVLPMITIGDDAVVGAGSVVISDVAEGAVVAGVPALPKK